MSTKKAIGRREFLSMGAAAAGLGLLADLEAYPQNVNRNSIPSDLKITDMRIAVLRGPGGQAVREGKGGVSSVGGSGGVGGPGVAAPPGDRCLLRLRSGSGIWRHDRRPDRYQSGNFGLRPGDRGRSPAELHFDA